MRAGRRGRRGRRRYGAIARPAACEECGFSFDVDLDRLIDRLLDRCATYAGLVGALLAGVDDHRLRTRSIAGVWAPIEYVAHVAQALEWYVDRIETVLVQERPQLAPHDFDAAAAAGGFRQRGAAQVMVDLDVACARLRDVAGSWGPQALGREGVGSDGSLRTVAQLVARAEHELVHHELDLCRGTTDTAT